MSSDKLLHLEYIQKILTTNENISFYQVKKYLELNNIQIKDIFLDYNKKYNELSILKFEFDETLELNITINKKSWVNYLPSIYRKNHTLIDFLKGFEIVSLSYTLQIDHIEDNFMIEKSQFVDWLASWFGIGFSANLQIDKKRELVYKLIELYKIRGTQKYLEMMLDFLFDIKYTIIPRYIPKEYLDDYDSDLFNINQSFTVSINERLSEDETEAKLKLKSIKHFIYNEKPAFTTVFFEYSFIDDLPLVKNDETEYDNSELEKVIEYHQEDVEYEDIDEKKSQNSFEEDIEYEDM